MLNKAAASSHPPLIGVLMSELTEMKSEMKKHFEKKYGKRYIKQCKKCEEYNFMYDVLKTCDLCIRKL